MVVARALRGTVRELTALTPPPSYIKGLGCREEEERKKEREGEQRRERKKKGRGIHCNGNFFFQALTMTQV